MEAVLVGLAHYVDGRLPGPPAEGDRHAADRLDTRWLQQRQVPGDRCAPVMPDHGHLLMAKMVHCALDIGAQGDQIVGLDRFRSFGCAITAHLGSKDAVALRRECCDLMAPGVPAFGETVQQPDRLAAFWAGDMHAKPYAVDLDQLLMCLLHTALQRIISRHYGKSMP